MLLSNGSIRFKPPRLDHTDNESELPRAVDARAHPCNQGGETGADNPSKELLVNALEGAMDG